MPRLTVVFAGILAGTLFSGLIQAQSVQPKSSNRTPVRPPAIQRLLDEKPDTSVFFTPSPRQIAAIQTLNAKFEVLRNEIRASARKQFTQQSSRGQGIDAKLVAQLTALQAQYDSAYRAILTPEQKAKFDRGKTIARLKSDSINAIRRSLQSSRTSSNSFSRMFAGER